MQPLQWKDLKALLPKRKPDANKGDFGHVLVIGGAPGFSGAVRLAGEAALRTGAGLVSIGTHSLHAPFLNSERPELMCHALHDEDDLPPLLQRATVIALGPGLGQTNWSKSLWKIITRTKKLLILDADGLNLLAQTSIKNDKWILTPHPGEAARLLNTSIESIQDDRATAIEKLQRKYGGIIVLKGAQTLIADDKMIFLNDVSNPAMATAGMGDVLTGVIASLVAQGLSLIDAAKLGVVIHSQAAEELTQKEGERGLLASDLWPMLRKLVNMKEPN